MVGATYSEQAEVLRGRMPESIILIPGYGAQGGGGMDALPCFNQDGYGGIVNSSRGITAAYQREPWKAQYGPLQFADAARASALAMKDDLRKALREGGISPW